jgi:poly(3-hydroxybutyrate) depolymerase
MSGTAGSLPVPSGGGGASGAMPLGGMAGALPSTGGATNGGGGDLGGAFTSGGTSTAGGVGESGGVSTAGGGGGSTGGRPSGPSEGCAARGAKMDEPQKAILHEIMVTNIAERYKPEYVLRRYYTSLPKDYDPSKAYPMIFYGQGCGQTTAESGPLSGGHFASDAMYIQLLPAVVTAQTVEPPGGAPGCFQAGRQGLADSPDGPYFDRVLAEIEAAYCVDKGKVYVAGWSSGAWLSNYLACARGNVIFGTAAGSGGLHHDHGPCTGGARVMLLPGDAGNTMEGGFDIGAAPARDLFVETNGCSKTPQDVKLGSQTCQVYGGCANPVAWCPAGGGHGGPLDYIADSAWQFWTQP